MIIKITEEWVNLSFDTWFQKGEDYLEEGRLLEAEEAYRKAIQIDYSSGAAWNGLAFVLMSQNRHEDALHCTRKAMELMPNEVLTWYYRGLVLNELGRYQEAEVAAHKALSINEAFSGAWMVLGDALKGQDRNEESEIAYSKWHNVHLPNGATVLQVFDEDSEEADALDELLSDRTISDRPRYLVNSLTLQSGRASFTLIPSGSDLPLEITRVFSVTNNKNDIIQISLTEETDGIDSSRIIQEFTFSDVIYSPTVNPRFSANVTISVVGDLTIRIKDLNRGTVKTAMGIVLDTTTSQPTIDLGDIPQIDKMKTNIERETILKEIILIVCPHCGAKNQQGIMKCSNCGGSL